MVALGLSQPTMSHHLNILVKAGLLTYQKRGRWVFYSISNTEAVKDLMQLADAYLEGAKR
jgi:ArsR family transcriptional regulator